MSDSPPPVRRVILPVLEVSGATDKAVLLTFEDDDGNLMQRWVPRSVIADGDDLTGGDMDISVSLSRWWANDNGLDYLEEVE
jgi:hypothetical protein